MSPIGLILLVALVAPAQNAPQNSPKPDQKNSQNHVLLQSHILEELMNRPAGISGQQLSLPDSSTCFTMRSYYFKRQDGAAPELVGTSTCTPANVFRSQKARRMNRPRLAPLKLQ